MQNGWTPLLAASKAGSAVAVELLLKNKANLHYKDTVCMGSMFQGELCVLWYFSVHSFKNRRIFAVLQEWFLVTEGWFWSWKDVVWCLVLMVFSSRRMYRLKAVMSQGKYMYVW